MKRFASFLAVVGLFAPTAAFAMTPGEIASAIETGTGNTYQLTMHSKTTEGIYFSLWAKGSMNMETSSMDMNLTLDIAGENGMKGRIKGMIRFMGNEGMYLKIDSMDGSFNDDMMSMAMNMRMKEWVHIGSDMLGPVAEYEDWLMIITGVDGELDDVFTVQESPAGTFVLQLKPDAASATAAKILDELGGDRPVVQDFFPWRALAESMEFQSVVKTAAGIPTSRATTMKVTGAETYFTLTMNEQFLQKAPLITAPATYKSLDDMFSTLMGLPSGGAMDGMSIFGESFDEIDSYDSYTWPEDEEMLMEDYDTEDYMDYLDMGSDDYDVWSGSCFAEDEASLVMLQRSGECPVEKVSRRNLVR